MKGLLVKDFELVKVQKNFFIIIIIVALGILILGDNVTMPIGFLTFIMSLFTLSTISYDEFDNGNAFLFTLPITRQSYVLEKYGFGLILGVGAWFCITAVSMIVILIKQSMLPMDLLMMSCMFLPFTLFLQAFMIPFQIEFGSEKGRIAILGMFGLIFIVGILIKQVAESIFHIDLLYLLDHLPQLDMSIIIVSMIFIAMILLWISSRISIAVMNKKEF
ncbi:ABC-2 transporter permease [Allocoprobacillus halotolerans]|uniref:ABC-2 transporter permease n=1 Tax=Allocoprobacillus halotolerans TaxID=2944914 RepID=A0ABY5I8S2_9FIRM|nr:ABC-2 transporter permease [Allocoprobacillus halotolerans]UTY40769.1 ABC-2 transporter permease [Allocoprobacillus halotolerans]